MNDYNLLSEQAGSCFYTHLEQFEDLFSVLDFFPIPAEVFDSDGLSLFVNKEFLSFFKINDANKIVGKFNILKDTYINQRLGLTDYVYRVFSGEILSFCDLRVPYEEINIRYNNNSDSIAENDMHQDITCFPIFRKDKSILCIVALFMIKRVYQPRLDAMKAKTYIDTHWIDDFNQDKVAASAGLSPNHLTRLFKKFIGKTPYSYYKDLKLEKIKEALRDTMLSISEVFAKCGADYNGRFADAFKRIVGMTPTQYRKTVALNSYKNQEDESNVSRNMKNPEHSAKSSQSYSTEIEKQLFKIAELFPIPIQIFKINGDIIFINEAVLKMWNVKNSDQIIGSYNLLKDSFVNEQYGLKDYIRRAFQGEFVIIPDIKIPLESFWEWYKTRSTVYDIEAIYTDILNFPILDNSGRMIYMMSIFFTSRIYQGKSDAAKIREYLENHWKEEFDIEKLSQAVYLSPSQLSRLFKKSNGMTPFNYFQEFKINRLKEALRDKNLSVSEAFESCGFKYSGNRAVLFKKKVGMTPNEYRKNYGK